MAITVVTNFNNKYNIIRSSGVINLRENRSPVSVSQLEVLTFLLNPRPSVTVSSVHGDFNMLNDNV